MAIALIGNAVFTTTNTVTIVSATVPGGIVAGDYLLFAVNTRGSATSTTTTPTGFTTIVDIPRSTNGRHYVFGKLADGSETSVATTVSNLSNHSAILLLIRGVDTLYPVNVSNPSSGASSATHTAPSVTTTVNNCYVVNFAATALSGSFNYSWSPGTSIVQAKSTNGGVDTVIGSAYLVQATAGATGTDVATMSSSANTWATSTIALTPLVIGGTLTGISVLQGISTLQF